MSLAPRVDLIENQVAAIQAANADKTLVSTDSRRQIFTGFTTTRNVTLPSTGVVAGETWRIDVVGATAVMALKSSNGNTITTISAGYVIVTALQATPTTSAHWLISDIENVEYAWSPSTSVTNGGTDNAGTSYGSQGTPFLAYASTTINNVNTVIIGFIAPIQAKDTIELQISNNSGVSWSSDLHSTAMPFTLQGSARLGIGLYVGGSTVAVEFGNMGRDNIGASYASAGRAWSDLVGGVNRWRVVKRRSL